MRKSEMKKKKNTKEKGAGKLVEGISEYRNLRIFSLIDQIFSSFGTSNNKSPHTIQHHLSFDNIFLSVTELQKQDISFK